MAIYKDDNEIYNVLVAKRSDFYGLVAFYLYKEDKKKWVKQFKEKNNTDPTDNDLESFYQNVNIQDYKEESKKKGHEFITKNSDGVIDAVRLQSITKIDERLKKVLDEYQFEQVKSAVRNYKPNDGNDNMTIFMDEYHEKNKKKTRRSNVFSSWLGSICFAATPILLLLLSYLAAPTFTKRFLKSFTTEERDSVVNNGQNTSPVSVTDENTAPYIPVDTTQSVTPSGKQPTN